MFLSGVGLEEDVAGLETHSGLLGLVEEQHGQVFQQLQVLAQGGVPEGPERDGL